jgi:hypothetical protein
LMTYSPTKVEDRDARTECPSQFYVKSGLSDLFKCEPGISRGTTMSAQPLTVAPA